jgi:hypothetical protein
MHVGALLFSAGCVVALIVWRALAVWRASRVLKELEGYAADYQRSTPDKLSRGEIRQLWRLPRRERSRRLRRQVTRKGVSK